MSHAGSAAPTTAEQIRSICTRAQGALLAIEHAEPVTTPIHHLLPDGSFAVAIPAGHAPAGTGRAVGRPAMIELVDYAPVPVREPVRSLVWIRGRLRQVPLPAVPPLLDLIAADNPNPALLQVEQSGSQPPDGHDTRYILQTLQIESVVATFTACEDTGAESVAPATLLAARPDPFCAVESCWLRHLDTAHQDVLARLASRLPVRLRRGSIRPVGLDRYGMRLRIEGDGNVGDDRDVRLAFAQPVDDAIGLSRAIRMLMGCPFANGLRARRC